MRKNSKGMTKKQRKELAGLEDCILKITHYRETPIGTGMTYGFNFNRDRLKALLILRKELLNDMFLCSPKEVSRLERVNARLEDMTQQMYRKTSETYRNSLEKAGSIADKDFHLEVRGLVRFEYRSLDSVIGDGDLANPYGSRFAAMMDIAHEFMNDWLICQWGGAQCRKCYWRDPDGRIHIENPDETDNDDDGNTWTDERLDRPELCHIRISLTLYRLYMDTLFSLPDILRMNDFRCEINYIYDSHEDGQNLP